MISFGPIPSRRLGKSLGINNIPFQKVCSYSCMYCQVGITKELSITRQLFYEPDTIFHEVQKHIASLSGKDKPDYLTFVSNGEPTLDVNLGESLKKLKEFNIPVAVITNASLLYERTVREDLKLANWVSVKIDAGNEKIWKKINRPFIWLDYEKHINGILEFSAKYNGKLVTETMLVEGINDSAAILDQTADLIKQINPSVAYISVPTRPPAISEIKPPNEVVINEAFQIFSAKKFNTELLIDFEGTNIGYTGNAIEDIINICAVHPVREDTMTELLNKNKADPHILESLLKDKLINKVCYQSHIFYIRKF